MTDVLLERYWDVPLVEAEAALMFESAEGCLGIHRVQWRGSVLSTDGLVMLCHFRAPDAESVRLALRQGGGVPGDAWPCAVHDAPGATAEDLARVNVVAVHRAGPAAHARAPWAGEGGPGPRGDDVRLVRAYASAQGRWVALYRAPDAEAVRRAQARAGVAPEGLWPVRRYAPGG